MSRITKDIANYVASKLTEKKKVEIEKLEKTFKENAYNAYLMKIPKDVMEISKKYKNYFKLIDQYKIAGNGWNYEYIYMNASLPSCDGNYATIQLDEKTSQSLLKEHNNIKDLKRKKEQLQDEIFTALIRLGTFKKVENEFKEAYIHLPKSVSQALVVNIDKIREKL